jgi:small membrane protein
MIAQIFFSLLLCPVFLYAWIEYRRSPVVAVLSSMVALAGVYFVWVPSHSTWLAEFVGIGRGVDLILYTWVGISLIVILNLHLKLRTQLELITILARKIALLEPAAAPVRVPDHSLAAPVSPASPVSPAAMAQDVSAAPRSREEPARAVTAGHRSLRTGDQTA